MTPRLILTVVAVLAFVAGVTKRWILEPLGDAFGDLPPSGQATIAVALVVAVAGLVAFERMRHRRLVLSASRRIAAQFDR